MPYHGGVAAWFDFISFHLIAVVGVRVGGELGI